MTPIREACLPSGEILEKLIQVELDPKKSAGFKEYASVLFGHLLTSSDSFIKNRISLLKPLGGNPNANIALPKTKGELLCDFTNGIITSQGLKRLVDHYEPL